MLMKRQWYGINGNEGQGESGGGEYPPKQLYMEYIHVNAIAYQQITALI